MDETAVIVASVLGTIAGVVSMVATLILCYIYWRRRGRSKPVKDEMEPLQVGAPSLPAQQSIDNDSVVELARHNVEDRITKGSRGLMSSVNTPAPKENAKPSSGQQTNRLSDEELQRLEESATEIPEEPAGQIQFSLEYDFYASTLVLKMIQGRDLPAMDLSGTSDPYVKVCMLPDKKRKLETKIKHRTLNPKWNETFYFEGFPLHKLQNSILHLHVYDHDRFSRDDSIGEVYVPLNQVDLTQRPTFWKTLKATESSKLGEILIALTYISRTSELIISLVKARNLKIKDITGSSDPYVKVWLMRGEKRLEKRKTQVHLKSLNPVFNESFQFKVSWEQIRETSLAVTVMDFDKVGRNEPIGWVNLSSRGSGSSESKHWGDMLAKARTAVAQWHKLKVV